MAVLTIQTPTEDGAALTYGAASAAGDTFPNIDDRTLVHVVNGGAAPTTVTVTAQKTTAKVQGLGVVAKTDRTVTIPAGSQRHIGPFPPQAFNDATGKVHLSYSATESVTVAAVRVTL